jgi:hypothetical protein
VFQVCDPWVAIVRGASFARVQHATATVVTSAEVRTERAPVVLVIPETMRQSRV